MLNKIFSVKNENFKKVITILGIKIKFSTNKLLMAKHFCELHSKIEDVARNNEEKITLVEQSLINKTNSLKQYVKELSLEPFREFMFDMEYDVLDKFYPYYDNVFNLEIYKKLISDLPQEDVETVDKIIIKQQRLRGTKGNVINLFSKKEALERQELKENFLDRILKISEDVYKWEKYYLPIRWFEPCVFYYKHGINYIENIESVRSKNIVDAGAFIGDSATVLASYTDKNVYSFEPMVKNIQLFNKTIELNELKNVVLEPFALGNEEKEIDFYVNTSSSSVKEFKHAPVLEKTTVKMIKLDDYVEKNNLEIGLIKTDLEGAEKMFLEGAKRTIFSQKPILLISIYHNAEDFFEIKPMINSWNLGYKFRIIKGTDDSASLETMLIAEVR